MRQRAEIRGQRSEEGCGFILQDAGGKLLTPLDCPEIRDGGQGNSAAGMGAEGREISFVPNRIGVLTFRPAHRWKRWAIIGRPCGTSVAGIFPGVSGTAKMMESGGEFVLEDIEGEMLTRRNCPEFGEDGEGRGKLARWSWGGDRLECTGRALTGLTNFFDVITWTCARRTRSSPGYHIGGLQPQSRSAPRIPSARDGDAGTPPGVLAVRRWVSGGVSHGIPPGCTRLRPRPPQWLCYGGWTAPYLKPRARLRPAPYLKTPE